MYKSKRFGYGFGAGLIIGALLLQLMWMGDPDRWTAPLPAQSSELLEEDDQQALSPSTLTREEWSEQAAKQGFQLFAAEDRVYTSAEVEQLQQQWQDEKAQLERDLSAIRADHPGSYLRVFKITPGMGSSEVAQLLLDLGMIEDTEQFLSALTKEGAHRAIGARSHRFESPPSLDELIQTLTK